MRRLEQLAQAAVGFDTRRGDQVVVENVSFSSNSPELKPPVMEQVMEQARTLAQTQPGLAKTLILGFCAVLLVLSVLRPMARQVVEALREPVLLTGGDGMLETPQTSALMSEAIVDPFALPGKTKEQMQHQGIFEQVAEHIRREPVQSTRLLEAWIGSSEEMDV
jgi:flagellar M-ring protein FliF